VRATITINNKTDTYPLMRGNADDGQGDVYSASIDAGRYTGRAQITINVIAEDRAGNETRVSRLVFVDSVPPWVSLDAPNIRVRTPDPAVPSGADCTASFDPVGEDAVNDLDVLKTEFGMYRAVIWERGISLKGETIVNVSTVEDGSAALFVQGQIKVPLIVDSDGDHVCDKISTNPDPTHPELAPVRVPLSQVTAPGALPPATDPANAPSMAGYCDPLQYTSAIGPMCPGTELRLAIEHAASSVGPVIYAVSPADGLGAGCAGLAWQASVSSGWACVVGTATDALGNVGISKPLRVCYDLDGKGCTGAAPSCTDGCTMPDVYVAQGMPRIVDQGG
jgi:hypothetical protein